jgi:hypothetical protein
MMPFLKIFIQGSQISNPCCFRKGEVKAPFAASREWKVISHTFLVSGDTKSYLIMDFSSNRHSSSVIRGLVLTPGLLLRWRTKGPASPLQKLRIGAALSRGRGKCLPEITEDAFCLGSLRLIGGSFTQVVERDKPSKSFPVGGSGSATIRFLLDFVVMRGLLLRSLILVLTVVADSQSIDVASLSRSLIRSDHWATEWLVRVRFYL